MKQLFNLLLSAFAVQLSSAQNVGIGTATPTAPLHIKSNTDEILRLQGANPYLSFFNYAGVFKSYIQGYGDDLLLGTYLGNSNGNIRFYTNNNLHMTIAPTSYVGVGTGNPAYKLTVQNSGYGLVHTNGVIDIGTYVNFGAGWLGTRTNHPLYFFTNDGGSQMTLLQNGNFGIGTTSPAAKLQINSDLEALRLSGSQPFLALYNGSNYKGYLWNKGADDIELGTAGVNTNGNLYLSMKGTPQLTVQSDGRVRVGTLPTVQGLSGTGQLPKFSVHGPFGLRTNFGDQIGEWGIYPGTISLNFFYNGDDKSYIDANGAYIQSSDFYKKENFAPCKSVLEGIKKLDVFTYNYKADKTNTRSFGLVAQNVHQYFPEIVSTSGTDKMLGMDYSKTGVLAIKAIQEQQVIIEKQNDIIEALKREAETTKARLEKLETLLLVKE